MKINITTQHLRFISLTLNLSEVETLYKLLMIVEDAQRRKGQESFKARKKLHQHCSIYFKVFRHTNDQHIAAIKIIKNSTSIHVDSKDIVDKYAIMEIESQING